MHINSVEIQPIGTRLANAQLGFESLIVEQFGKTPAEARKAFEVMLKLKTIKLQAGIGRYNVVHGAYWDLCVIDNAIAAHSKYFSAKNN